MKITDKEIIKAKQYIDELIGGESWTQCAKVSMGLIEVIKFVIDERVETAKILNDTIIDNRKFYDIYVETCEKLKEAEIEVEKFMAEAEERLAKQLTKEKQNANQPTSA